MVNPVEQFTAPGKYYYDLAMELIEAELKNPISLYNNSEVSKKDCTLNNNYNTSFNITKK